MNRAGTRPTAVQQRASKGRRALPTLVVCLIGLFPNATAATAQGFNSARPSAIPSQAGVASLLDDLGGIRAEYKADIGLNVLEFNWDKIAPRKRLEALTAIFDTAPQMLYKASAVYAANQPMSLAGNDAGLLNQMKIDALDVQTRAVRLLLHGEMPQKAADFFAQIALPTRRAACADPLVDDLGSYYQTLALLMSDDRIQMIGGLPKTDFFLTVVRAANDPERIAPLVSVMGKLKLGDDDLRISAGYLTQNIQSSDASDREEVALSRSLLSGVSQLVRRMRDAQIPPARLLSALRTNLSANLSRSYCSDVSARREAIASSFNSLLTPASPDLPRSIDPAELRPITGAGSAAVPVIAEDISAVGPAFRRIVDANEARQAANSDPGTAGTIEPDGSDVDQLLRFALSPVDGNADCPLCQLVARGEMFGNLQNFLPSGRMLESWINGEVEFLTLSPLEDEDPPTYMMILKTLIDFSRPQSAETRRYLAEQVAKGELPQYPLEEPEFVHKQLRASSDPVIRAYMKYEDLFRPEFVPLGSNAREQQAAQKQD
jgi:hypothetical protein